MGASDNVALVRAAYGAYESGDRGAIERVLGDDYVFYSPADPGIDRERYFQRCWPNAQAIAAFRFERLAEVGDEVLVMYEATRTDGSRFRNTEIFGFAGGRIARTEVYFGWDLLSARQAGDPRPASAATSASASTAVSIWSSVSAAETWILIRAVPSGTTR